jgi:hypothetical protein
MTLGDAAAAHVQLIGMVVAIRPNPAPPRWLARYGAEMTVIDWVRAIDLFPLCQPAGGLQNLTGNYSTSFWLSLASSAESAVAVWRGVPRPSSIV